MKIIQDKKFWRKVRSRLKRHLKRNGSITHEQIVKYNINKAKEKRRPSNNERELEINIPEVMSLIDQPESTCAFLDNLRNKLKTQKPTEINFIHKNTKKICLAASYIFDTIIKQYINERSEKKKKVRYKGILSENKEINNFLLAFGLLKELSINHVSPTVLLDRDYADKYYSYKMTGNKDVGYKKSNASTGLVDYFNNCFMYNDLELTQDAQDMLISVFGEIIDNAETHSGGKKGEWFVLGCYNKASHVCSYAIINYGKTIYENLSDSKSTATDVIAQVLKIIESHKNIFERTLKSFTKESEEPLWNVMALQDGISSRRTETVRRSTCGQGFMTVIDFIDKIRSSEAGSSAVSVISGKSSILIDYEYPIKIIEVGENREARKIISFNSEGDLHESQDKEKVKTLQTSFPGTVLSGYFKIDKKYLLEKMEKK